MRCLRRLTCAGEVVEVCDIHAEQLLDLFDRCLISGGEHVVNVTNDGLNVCRAVLGHVLADYVKVTPVIPESLSVITHVDV